MLRPYSLLVLMFVVLISAQSFVAQDEDDDEILKIESNLVILNASITNDKDRPVIGLRKELFSVFENGDEQTIDFFAAEETPFAAVILMDTSGSMKSRVSFVMSAAINFISGLREQDNVAIYNFDSKVSLVQDFSNSRDISHRAYDLKAEGMTVLNDAIYKAAEELNKRPEKRKAIIVLSDGEDSQSKRSEGKALKAAIAADAIIYTVDMSDANLTGNRKINIQRVLRKFANKTGGTFIKTPGGARLREELGNIVFDLGNQYTLGYQPTNDKKDGKWRKIELRVKRPNLNIRTREGYNAAKEK